MSTSNNQPYKVLALKYRPENFNDLIGQDILVNTLTNAINTNHIANAFLLTGIRGVGKTTTARIIARALNCIGADDQSGPTPNPCGICNNCTSIKEDRHPDVIEMDAASRTGVDDIREIISSVKYLPISSRYKIYIIDEVHMLSKNAFNALLKTLEEPPTHVKFIFATTEIRKIPITILSRCQRFDLRRIDNQTLIPFLQKVASQENAQIEPAALEIISNASEGSVRDALSLLDQITSHTSDLITAQTTQDMLGIADKNKIIDIFENIATGQTEKALNIFKTLYDSSADPILILNDLLDFNYLTTKLKVIPQLDTKGQISETQHTRAKEITQNLSMAYLTRCWQILLKGINEAKTANNTYTASEMIIIRLAHISDLPTPASIIKKLQGTTPNNAQSQNVAAQSITSTNTTIHASQPNSPTPNIIINNFAELVKQFNEQNEVLLYNWLISETNLVKFEPGKLEIAISPTLPADFTKRISSCLTKWTGQNWVIIKSNQNGEPSLHQQQELKSANLKKELAQHSDVNKILETFPGAYISNIEETPTIN